MSTLAQTAPSETASRLRCLLRSFRAATLDSLAFLGGAFDRQALAVEADGIHDRHLAAARRQAALGAQESDIFGCGCSSRFDRLVSLIGGAQRFDAIEDGHYDGGFQLVQRGAARMRVAGSMAERLLSGRER